MKFHRVSLLPCLQKIFKTCSDGSAQLVAIVDLSTATSEHLARKSVELSAVKRRLVVVENQEVMHGSNTCAEAHVQLITEMIYLLLKESNSTFEHKISFLNSSLHN